MSQVTFEESDKISCLFHDKLFDIISWQTLSLYEVFDLKTSTWVHAFSEAAWILKLVYFQVWVSKVMQPVLPYSWQYMLFFFLEWYKVHGLQNHCPFYIVVFWVLRFGNTFAVFSSIQVVDSFTCESAAYLWISVLLKHLSGKEAAVMIMTGHNKHWVVLFVGCLVSLVWRFISPLS